MFGLLVSRDCRAVPVPVVPTPVRALSALLATQAARQDLAELHRVERELVARSGLDSVPPNVLRTAADQLDGLVRGKRSSGLAFLQLQMRRRITCELARDEAASRGEPVNWRPRAQLAANEPGSTHTGSTLTLTSLFPETVPTDANDDGDSGSDSDSSDAPWDDTSIMEAS